MLCTHRPNVYLDISGYQSTLRADGTAKVVRTAVARGINHKILFGTDWPVFRLQATQQGFVAALTEEDGALCELSDREQAMVLSRNIERLLSRDAQG
jgi:predicted TIM-barrel fold metal-dependent hydrolase